MNLCSQGNRSLLSVLIIYRHDDKEMSSTFQYISFWVCINRAPRQTPNIKSHIEKSHKLKNRAKSAPDSLLQA